MFRDESRRISQKYQILPSSSSDDSDANRTPRASSEESSQDDSTTPPSSCLSLTTHSTSRSGGSPKSPRPASTPADWGLSHPRLVHPLPDLATNFFLAQYVPGSHFDYLPFLCRSVSAGSLLSVVVGAVAIASLSHETRNPELMAHARREYARSLKQTNVALARPDASCRDDILASILLLAHFEALASEATVAAVRPKPSYSPSETWAHHINGAYTLLQMRVNTRHVATQVTSKLCHHLIDTVRGHCIQHCVRLPKTIRTLDFGEDVYVHDHDPRRRFAFLIEAFAELRAEIDEGSIAGPAEVIRRGTAIDDQAALVTQELDDTAWAYESFGTSRDIPGVYRHQYHLYPDHRAAQRWNTMRMTRMSVNEIMHGYADVTPEFADRRDRFAKTARQMATEICQSTSQFLTRPGLLERENATTTKLSVASAYFLIWPLFTSANCSLAPTSVRTFAIDRLDFIDEEMRIPQARRAARMLEEGDGDENWMHMMHLF
jgi:hypothetical protein